ncbi:hypothetical protein GN956_G23760 [Arapaima gigas]
MKTCWSSAVIRSRPAQVSHSRDQSLQPSPCKVKGLRLCNADTSGAPIDNFNQSLSGSSGYFLIKDHSRNEILPNEVQAFGPRQQTGQRSENWSEVEGPALAPLRYTSSTH